MANNKHLPTAEIGEVDGSQKTQRIVSSLLELYELGPCLDNEQLKDRINDYFQFCERSSIRPGLESLSLALHIDRATFWRWCNGDIKDKERVEIAKAAKGLVSATLEQMALNGAVNPPVAIFCMKNWLGYTDTKGLEIVEKDKDTAKSMDDIKRQLGSLIASDSEDENIDDSLPYFD